MQRMDGLMINGYSGSSHDQVANLLHTQANSYNKWLVVHLVWATGWKQWWSNVH